VGQSSFCDREGIERGLAGELVDGIAATDAAVENRSQGRKHGLEEQSHLWVRVCITASGIHLINLQLSNIYINHNVHH
jgi:hypothetical protein